MFRPELAGVPIDVDDTFSLVVVTAGEAVLVGRKTRGFGEGLFALPGGKDQINLPLGSAAISGAGDASRELRQETGLILSEEELLPVGNISVTTADDERFVQIYKAEVDEPGPIADTDELIGLAWIPRADLPYDRMPADYALWLPHVLDGRLVNADLIVDGDAMHGTVIVASGEAGDRPMLLQV